MGVAGRGEGDSSEVGEGNKGVVLLEILDNPLSIVLAEVSIDTTSEAVGDRLAVGVVGDDSSSGSLGAGSDLGGDGVTGSNGDASKIVCIIWVPLVPSIISDGRS